MDEWKNNKNKQWKKAKFGSSLPLILGGSSATSPLKIWDVMPEDTLRANSDSQLRLQQKKPTLTPTFLKTRLPTQTDNVDHICCLTIPKSIYYFPYPPLIYLKNPLGIKVFPVSILVSEMQGSDSSSFKKPTPTPAVLKKLRLQQF